MDCRETNELLSLYIDNMLDEKQMNLVYEHLSVCDTCKEEYYHLKNISALLSETDELQLPPSFDNRLSEAIQAEKRLNSEVSSISRKKTVLWKRLSSVAAIFVIGLCTILLYNYSDNLFKNAAESDGDALISKKTETSHKEENLDESTVILGKQYKAAAVASEEEEVLQNTANNENNKKNSVLKNTLLSDNISDIDAANNDFEEDIKDNTVTSGNGDVESKTTSGESVLDTLEIFQASPTRHISTPDFESAEEINNITQEAVTDTRDSSAIMYYIKQLETELAEYDYTILSCVREKDGIWQFKIQIKAIDGYGNETISTVFYFGQEGTIWRKEL